MEERFPTELGALRVEFARRAEGDGQGMTAKDAVEWIRKAAGQGLAKAQFNLGVSYYNGEGVPEDAVQAHMWVTLAASRLTGEDRDQAVGSRDMTANLMTPEQLAEAQRLAREWDEAHPRN